MQGVRPELAELMVTSGGMECIALVGESVIEPGDTVAVEAPTYLGALMAFARAGAEIASIPMDADGLDVAAFEERLDGGLRPEGAVRDPRVPEPVGAHAVARAPRTSWSSCAAATAC